MDFNREFFFCLLWNILEYYLRFIEILILVLLIELDDGNLWRVIVFLEFLLYKKFRRKVLLYKYGVLFYGNLFKEG